MSSWCVLCYESEKIHIWPMKSDPNSFGWVDCLRRTDNAPRFSCCFLAVKGYTCTGSCESVLGWADCLLLSLLPQAIVTFYRLYSRSKDGKARRMCASCMPQHCRVVDIYQLPNIEDTDVENEKKYPNIRSPSTRIHITMAATIFKHWTIDWPQAPCNQLASKLKTQCQQFPLLLVCHGAWRIMLLPFSVHHGFLWFIPI